MLKLSNKDRVVIMGIGAALGIILFTPSTLSAILKLGTNPSYNHLLALGIANSIYGGIAAFAIGAAMVVEYTLGSFLQWLGFEDTIDLKGQFEALLPKTKKGVVGAFAALGVINAAPMLIGVTAAVIRDTAFRETYRYGALLASITTIAAITGGAFGMVVVGAEYIWQSCFGMRPAPTQDTATPRSSMPPLVPESGSKWQNIIQLQPEAGRGERHVPFA